MGSVLKLKNPFDWLRIGPEYWYEKVEAGQEGHELSTQDEERELYEFRMAKLRKRWRLLMFISALNAGFLVMGLTLMGSILLAVSATANGRSAKDFSYSPVTDTLKIQFEDVKIKGSVFPPTYPLYSRAEPHDSEAEARWADYERTEYFPIIRRQLLQIKNFNAKESVQFPDEIFGLGKEVYVGSLESGHKIQCLNDLRKASFARYPTKDGQTYFSGSQHDATFRNETYSDSMWLHLRRCVDILAQDIMCHADPDVVTYRFKDMQPHPQPDLSVSRKCRSWDDLMAWRDSHKIDETSKKKFEEDFVFDSKPPKHLLENERGFYKTNGFDGSLFYPYGNGFDV